MAVLRKKQFEIIKSSKRAGDIKGLVVGNSNRRMKFDKDGRMVTTDKVVAHDIDEKYGKEGTGDVVVVEVDDMDPNEPNHRGHRSQRVFAVGEMPWKKKSSG